MFLSKSFLTIQGFWNSNSSDRRREEFQHEFIVIWTQLWIYSLTKTMEGLEMRRVGLQDGLDVLIHTQKMSKAAGVSEDELPKKISERRTGILSRFFQSSA